MILQRLAVETVAKRANRRHSLAGGQAWLPWWSTHSSLSTYPEPPSERTDHLVAVAHQYAGPDGAVIAQLIAESQYDGDTLSEFHQHCWVDRRRVVIRVMERGRAEGALLADLGPRLVATLVYAPLNHRPLLRDGPLTAAFARQVASLGLASLGVAVTQCSSSTLAVFETIRSV